MSDFRGRFCIQLVPFSENSYFYIQENGLVKSDPQVNKPLMFLRLFHDFFMKILAALVTTDIK
jgi:hypothetical protein